MKSIVESPWDFACAWYQVEDIRRGIAEQQRKHKLGEPFGVPENVYSPEFAEWLTEQYRLAMRKGAELAIAEMESKPCIHAIVRRFNSDENFTSDY